MLKAPLTGFSFVLLLFSLGLAAFIDGLDFSIANVAVPSIAATFGVSSKQGTWVITLFAVSNAIALCLTGRLAARFGAVKILFWSIIFFTLASLMCGLSWSFNTLLFFRIIQGIVAGPLMTLPQSLILANAPEEKKQMGTAILLMLVILAPILGPFVGGWITENYGWPWIFLINVPLGFISAFIVWALLRKRETTRVKMPIDIIGFVFLVAGIGTLQVLLDRGNDDDWFNSNEIIVLSIISGLGIFFTIIWNWYTEQPLLELKFFKDKDFTLGTILSTLPYLIIGGTTILIPLWLQTQKGYTPYWAGVAVMPMGILPIFISPMLAKFQPYLSQRAVALAGYLIYAYTCFWFSDFTTDISLTQIMLPRFIQGAAIVFCFLPLFQITLSRIDEEDLTKATGMHNAFRTVFGGSGLSTAVYVTAWQRRAALHHNDLVEVMHPLHSSTIEAYTSLREVGADDATIAVIFDELVTGQAYVIAFNDLMWLSGWLLILFMPIIWFCKEPLKGRIIEMTE